MTKKEHHQSALSFLIMSLEFRIRDWLRPPKQILLDAGMLPGMTVLDFGCGPGGFSLAAARLVGKEGRVYAVDINPLALKSVRALAEKGGQDNIFPISADRTVELAGESVDMVLLYDVLRDLSRPDLILGELHRLRKPNGVLSVGDHHLKEDQMLAKVTSESLFRPAGGGPRSFQFEKWWRRGRKRSSNDPGTGCNFCAYRFYWLGRAGDPARFRCPEAAATAGFPFDQCFFVTKHNLAHWGNKPYDPGRPKGCL